MSATPVGAPADPDRVRVLGFLFLLFLAVVGVAVMLAVNLWNFDPGACLSVESRTPGWRFVGAAVVGVFVGRYSGALRFLERWENEEEATHSAMSDWIGRIVVAIIFFALVPIFVYEAVGIYQPASGLEPITYYVRCSIWLDDAYGQGYRTLGIMALIGFLFGQWLWTWHPTGTQFRGQFGSRLRGLGHELASKRALDLPRRRTSWWRNPSPREGSGADRRGT